MRRSTVSLVRSRSGPGGEANRVASNSLGEHKKLRLFPAAPAKLYGFRLAAFCLAAASGHTGDACLLATSAVVVLLFHAAFSTMGAELLFRGMFAAGWSCERHLI